MSAVLTKMGIASFEFPDSSAIISGSYNYDECYLTLKFSSDGIYRYQGVPSYLFHQLLGAESAGQFMSEFIRGKFMSNRIDN